KRPRKASTFARSSAIPAAICCPLIATWTCVRQYGQACTRPSHWGTIIAPQFVQGTGWDIGVTIAARSTPQQQFSHLRRAPGGGAGESAPRAMLKLRFLVGIFPLTVGVFAAGAPDGADSGDGSDGGFDAPPYTYDGTYDAGAYDAGYSYDASY